jgi:disulfide bond formation protein DsbB
VTTPTRSFFFAVLALLALAGTAVGIAVLVAARRGEPGGPAAVWREDLRGMALPLAFVVALVGTLGSLYYSEIAHFVPCKLCWYQRIGLYPLTVLLGIAALRRDAGIRLYVIAQAAIGLVISAYHSWIQAFPPSGGSSFCTVEAPCTERYVWQFGFVSLPFMAFCAFAAVITAMVIAGPTRTRVADPALGSRPHERALA